MMIDTSRKQTILLVLYFWNLWTNIICCTFIDLKSFFYRNFWTKTKIFKHIIRTHPFFNFFLCCPNNNIMVRLYFVERKMWFFFKKKIRKTFNVDFGKVKTNDKRYSSRKKILKLITRKRVTDILFIFFFFFTLTRKRDMTRHAFKKLFVYIVTYLYVYKYQNWMLNEYTSIIMQPF